MIIYSSLGRYGRFANALYQIAGTIGIATKSGQPYGFPQFLNYDHRDRFGSAEDIEIYKHLVNPLPELISGVHYEPRFIHWGYHDVRLPSGNWDLSGHLQSPRYFNHCMDLVRETLRFKDEPPLNDLCAIHLRCGDYLNDPDAYHPRCTIEYYRHAMSFIPQGTRFLVFSDDQDEARRMFAGVDAEFSSGNYIEDYKLMKSCKHFIISNSSYSAFAATMANREGKIVVAPRRWFGPVAGIDGNDIYGEGWVVI